MADIWKRLADCRAELEAAGGSQSGRGREALMRLDALTREGRRREEESLALLREAALVISATSAPRVLELALDAMIRLSGAQRGFILLSHADGAQEVAAARNMERGRIADAAAEISRRVVGAVLAEGKPVRLEDALHTEPFSLAESVTRLKLLSVLCAPIRADDRISGLPAGRVAGAVSWRAARPSASSPRRPSGWSLSSPRPSARRSAMRRRSRTCA